MKKLFFITPEYLPLSGGTGSYVYYLTRELISCGYSITVVTGSHSNCDITINDNYSVYFLKIPKMPIVKSFIFAGSSYRKLNKLRDAVNVDLTHVNLPLVPDFAVPPNFGNEVISTVHSTWKGEAEAIKSEPYTRINSNEKFMRSFNWFLRLFEERMLSKSNKIIAVSDFTRRELLRYYKVDQKKIHVIHNGVDVKKFEPCSDKKKAKAELGLNPEDIIVLSVGRLYARKGLFTLLDCIPAVVRHFKNVKFVISGKGQSDEMKKLVNHASFLGIKDNILFTGYFPDEKLPKLFQAADIFAFSTFYENLPFALLEALSTGLPVVTTHVGGIPEMITSGKNGFLVEPSHPKALSDKILFLLDHPKEALEMGYLARKTVLDRFDWKLIVKKVLKVYS